MNRDERLMVTLTTYLLHPCVECLMMHDFVSGTGSSLTLLVRLQVAKKKIELILLKASGSYWYRNLSDVFVSCALKRLEN